jgi:hypothetical protein
MPHFPKSVTHLPSMAPMGSPTRLELVSGSQKPQVKNQIPVKRPEKKSTSNPFLGKISPRTYAGTETNPDHIFSTLYGFNPVEADNGVMVSK